MNLDYNEFRLRNNMPPLPPPTTGHKRHHNIQLSEEAWDGLRNLAAQLGYASWQGGNVTLLLEALGNNMFELKFNMKATTNND